MKIPFRTYSTRHPLSPRSLPIMTVLAILLLLPAAVQAQARFGEIRGVVTEAATGNPMAGVTIGLFSSDGEPLHIGSYTGYEGEYLIANVGPGRYQLKAIESGYTTVMVPELLVTVGVTTRQNFQMEPLIMTGRIRGVVTDAESGTPLAAVNVVLFELDGTATTMGAFTNAEGEYVIINVTPGQYLLRVSLLDYKTVEVPNLLVTQGVTIRQPIRMEKRSP